MAYARLIFPVNTPVLSKLKDIAKFCSGNINAVEDLEFADSTLSQVVVYEAAGWDLQFTAFQARGTATLSEYILSSKCLDDSKIKYCSLSATVNSTAPSSPPTSLLKPTSSATTGFLFAPISSRVISNRLYSPCFYVNTLVGGTTYSIYSAVDLSARIFYISCSRRKLFIFSESTINSFVSILEFPETFFTRTNKNLPVISFNSSDIGRASVNASVNPSNGYISALANSTVTVYSVIAFHNWYSNSDRRRQNRLSTGVFNQDSLLAPYTGSINIDGNPSIMFYPLIDVRTSSGEETHFYSSMTEIYLVSRPPSFVSSGREVTMNNQTYVLLNSGTSASTYETIAIKKA